MEHTLSFQAHISLQLVKWVMLCSKWAIWVVKSLDSKPEEYRALKEQRAEPL
jgi:hypothetical protein